MPNIIQLFVHKLFPFLLLPDFSTQTGDKSPSTTPALENRRIDELDLGFMNHNAAFKSKSTWQVFRGYIVYQLCSIGPLVENNEKVKKQYF